jgi:lipopolysaccharide/colanic/teichoic acid biosynthesis glycosyltransferase
MPRREDARRWVIARAATGAGDVLAVGAAGMSAAVIRYGVASADVAPVLPFGGVVTAAGLPLIFVALFAAQGLYARDALLGGHWIYGRIVNTCMAALLGVIVLSYLLGGPPVVSRAWLLMFVAFSAGAVSLNRFIVRRVIWSLRRRGWFIRRIVIAGANRGGVELAQQLNAPVQHGCEVVGFADDYLPIGTEVLPGQQVLAHPRELDELTRRVAADEVIVVPQALTWESLNEVVERSARERLGYVVQIAPTSYDLVTSGLEITHRAYVPLVSMQMARIPALYRGLKRAMDVTAAALGLAVALPVFAYGAWRRLRSVTPRVFERVEVFGGVAGRRVGMLSFAPELPLHPALQRIPALWNVLRGELGLVGPRPIALDEASVSEGWRSKLAGMKPGLLGLWRLRTDVVDLEGLARLDLYYVRNYTIALDMQVLLETVSRTVRSVWSERESFHRWRLELPVGGDEGAAGTKVATMEAR